MQTFAADRFRGARLRLSGYVKSEDVVQWAGLWMRIDGPRGEMLGFDNMQDRPIKGTRAWTRHTIVLDVPDTSQAIAFGILLSGAGRVWLDDLEFDVVDESVPVTHITHSLPPQPINLDFETVDGEQDA
jgi:hypothetical protein